MFIRKTPTRTCRYICQYVNFRRNESTAVLVPLQKNPTYNDTHRKDGVQTNVVEDGKDGLMEGYLSINTSAFSSLSNQISNQERIFQDSSFQTLSMSDHGSLVQDIQKESGSSKGFLDDVFSGGGYSVDEEELNVNFRTYESRGNEKTKRHPVNSIKRAMSKNPNERKLLKLASAFNDYKIAESSIDEFYKCVVGDDNVIATYDFKMPIFPSELDNTSLKKYLKLVNSIDFSYDSKGYERLVFYDMYGLVYNIHKFEGIVDREIMHLFIKYFCNYSMIRTVFRVIDKFEKVGITPNRNTLHILIYKLGKISNLNSRKDLLQLYLIMGMKKWKVSTDLTTRALMYSVEKPSRKRLALAKALRNEGVDHSSMKWEMCRDYVTIEVNSRPKTSFSRMAGHIKKLANLGNSNEDMCKVFQIYIDTITHRNKTGTAFHEILAHPHYEGVANWETIVRQLLEANDIWGCLAVVNLLANRKGTDLRRVIFPLLHNYKQLYAFFTKQKFKKHHEKHLFCSVMTLLQELCHTKMTQAAAFVGSVQLEDNIVVGKIDREVREEFKQIRLWDGKCRDFSCFSPIAGSHVGRTDIMRLWDAYVLEGERESMGMLSVDPLSFPWRLKKNPPFIECIT